MSYVEAIGAAGDRRPSANGRHRTWVSTAGGPETVERFAHLGDACEEGCGRVSLVREYIGTKVIHLSIEDGCAWSVSHPVGVEEIWRTDAR